MYIHYIQWWTDPWYIFNELNLLFLYLHWVVLCIEYNAIIMWLKLHIEIWIHLFKIIHNTLFTLSSISKKSELFSTHLICTVWKPNAGGNKDGLHGLYRLFTIHFFETDYKSLPPPPSKTQYVHFRSHTEYFLLPWKITEEISRLSMVFHN